MVGHMIWRDRSSRQPRPQHLRADVMASVSWRLPETHAVELIDHSMESRVALALWSAQKRHDRKRCSRSKLTRGYPIL